MNRLPAGEKPRSIDAIRRLDDDTQIPIEALGLSKRVRLNLHLYGIHTVPDLVVNTEDSLRSISGLQEQDLAEITAALGRFGLRLGQDFVVSASLQKAARALPDAFWQYSSEPIPLATLDLPPRIHNALLKAGITSVGELLRHAEADIWRIRNIGRGAVATLKEVLADLGLKLRESPQERFSPLARVSRVLGFELPQYVFPRKVELSGHTQQECIPIEVLGLPVRPYNALRRGKVYTIEELTRFSEQDVLGFYGIGKRSLEQIRTALGQVGLSLGRPLVITAALQQALEKFREHARPEQLIPGQFELPLEQVIACWLSDLSEEQLEVLALRYGLKGEPLPVEEVARLTGNTALEVVAIEARALRKVGGEHHRPLIDPLATFLRTEISRAGGLVTESNLASALRNTYSTEKVRPIGVARLVMRVYEDFMRLPGEDTWGLVEYPLAFVPVVRSFLAGIWERLAGPIALEHLWQQVQQYREQQAEPLPDDFLLACIRTDPRIEIREDGVSLPRADEKLPQPSFQNPSLDLLIDAWLSPQDDRGRQVIWNRYGLGDGQQRTLEECGQMLGVTRERVRQIQQRRLKHLAHPGKIVMLAGIIDAIYRGMRSAGTLMTKEEVGQYLASMYPVEHVHPVAAGRLLLLISSRFEEVIREYLWGLPAAPLALVHDVQNEMVRILKGVGLPLFPSQLVARFKETSTYQRHRHLLRDDFIAACLRTHPEIDRDSDNRCVLQGWSKRRLDEIVLALHELGRPAHFTLIAERANMLLLPGQQISAQTVRAYMERRTDIFVSLGRGMYWLRDQVTGDEAHLPAGDLALRFDRLARWQIEFDGRGNDVGHDTHTEVEKIRRIGLDFFSR